MTSVPQPTINNNLHILHELAPNKQSCAPVTMTLPAMSSCRLWHPVMSIARCPRGMIDVFIEEAELQGPLDHERADTNST
jgi:hypothetical protein